MKPWLQNESGGLSRSVWEGSSSVKIWRKWAGSRGGSEAKIQGRSMLEVGESSQATSSLEEADIENGGRGRNRGLWVIRPRTTAPSSDVYAVLSWGVGDGQGGLECYGSWGRGESDTTEQLNWTMGSFPVFLLPLWLSWERIHPAMWET